MIYRKINRFDAKQIKDKKTFCGLYLISYFLKDFFLLFILSSLIISFNYFSVIS
jgi:hypothetical protein